MQQIRHNASSNDGLDRRAMPLYPPGLAKAMDKLKILRDKIDQLDESLMQTLAMRFEITSEIGKLKKAEKLPPVDSRREQQQVEKISAIAKRVGLREKVALAVLRVIIDTVVEEHKKI